MFYHAETYQHGGIATSTVLFTSQTNNVDATFTSDFSERRSGFTLDIRSVLCSELVYPEDEDSGEYCDYINAQDLVIAAGEILQGALVTDTENDGKYLNHECQKWNIRTDETQVYVVF